MAKADNYKKLAKETKKELSLAKWKNDTRILMPFQVAIMRTDMSKIQQNIMLSILEKIKDKLYSILNKEVLKGKELSLFAAEELGERKDTIKMQLLFKDFGVSANNYAHLAESLAAIATVPVQFPYVSPSGRQYRVFDNLCRVVLPEDFNYARYCLIEMNKDVAENIMNFDLGHLYVGKKTSNKMETKYSERLYWYIKAHADLAGATISIKEFRETFGLKDKYKSFSMLEKKVLEKSEKELKEKFDKDEIECCFTYEKIYNGTKKRGTPDAIRFTIYSNKEDSLDDKYQKFIDTRNEVIGEILREDLLLPNEFISNILAKITEDNFEAFKQTIANIKLYLVSKEESKSPVINRTAYIIKSINNFFNNFKSKETFDIENISDSNDDYMKIWNKCVNEVCATLSKEAIDNTFAKIKRVTYNKKDNSLLLSTSREVMDLLEKTYSEHFFKTLKIYFGANIRLNYQIVT